jgi:hypothetical protein
VPTADTIIIVPLLCALLVSSQLLRFDLRETAEAPAWLASNEDLGTGTWKTEETTFRMPSRPPHSRQQAQ